MVKLHMPCCLKPYEDDDKWSEDLRKKVTIHADYLLAKNLSFIPLYAFAGMKNVTVSTMDK